MPRQSAPAEVFDLTDDLPEVLALESMTVNELAERYAEVFGEPTRSRNRQHLIRSVAWRIQEKALGGLSAETLARIATLAEEAPRSWRRRLLDAGPRKTPQTKARAPEPKAPPKPRDPRLPPEGTTLRRVYRGETHEVLVREQDYEYRGSTFPSLSAIARDITGTSWNGFAFFRCSPAASEAAETSPSYPGPRETALRHLHTQVDDARARPGVLVPRRPVGRLCGVRARAAGLGASGRALRRWRLHRCQP